MALELNPDDATPSTAFASQASVFRTTRWDVIRLAQAREGDGGYEGMERLARMYWYPLYAFARRQGLNEHDAQDLTQGFLARFVTGDFIQAVRPEKGRFRSFLLACFKNYLADERKRTGAIKRGGSVEFVPFDVSGAEERYQAESGELNSDEHYDLDWAQSLMSGVLERLSAESHRTSKQDKLVALQPFLMEDPPPDEQRVLQAKLGLSDSGFRSALQRLRFRFGEYLWTEIAKTVKDTTDVEEETRYVLAILSAANGVRRISS